jgi:hypothetical protein
LFDASAIQIILEGWIKILPRRRVRSVPEARRRGPACRDRQRDDGSLDKQAILLIEAVLAFLER